MSGVNGFRGHTISGRGINPFKPLRRLFRADARAARSLSGRNCRKLARGGSQLQSLELNGFRGHAVSGRGINPFKPLRRHFRAAASCAVIPKRCNDGVGSGRPNHEMLKVQNFGTHTISERELMLFKHLWRLFRANARAERRRRGRPARRQTTSLQFESARSQTVQLSLQVHRIFSGLYISRLSPDQPLRFKNKHSTNLGGVLEIVATADHRSGGKNAPLKASAP